MGTILNGQAEVFQTIAAGVAKHKGVQLVLSIGDQLEPEQIGPVPNNAIIVKRAPQLQLLKLASVCITHSGVNTVPESLAQGVPQVAIPVTFDQAGIAARIAYHKTGMVTSLDKLSAAHLSTLLSEVLSDLTYREKCLPDPESDCEGQQALRCSRSDRTFLGSSHENAGRAARWSWSNAYDFS